MMRLDLDGLADASREALMSEWREVVESLVAESCAHVRKAIPMQYSLQGFRGKPHRNMHL